MEPREGDENANLRLKAWTCRRCGKENQGYKVMCSNCYEPRSIKEKTR